MNNLVTNLLAKQHGVASLRQLVALPGVTSDQIDGLARRGRLVRVAWGVVMAAGAPMTPEAEMLIAVFRSGEGAELRGAIDAARWKRRPTTAGLLSCLGQLPRGYVPAARVKALVDRGALDAESERERLMVIAVGDEFGPVELQVWVTSKYRGDGYLREHGLLLEYQGEDHRTDAGRRKDRKRNRELNKVGIEVIEVFDEDLRYPAALRARIRRAIAEGRRMPDGS